MLGRTLDSTSFSPRAGGVGVDLMADYAAAQRLLCEVRLASLNYWTAVVRCVDGDLHRQGCGLEDTDFCHRVYSGVVALEKDLENS